LCFSEKYTARQISGFIKGQGGMVAYLGSNDMREISQRIRQGDAVAREITEAMAYQVAKEIGAQSAVLRGEIDAIVFTGGIAFDEALVAGIKQQVAFLAPILVIAGELEMEALNLGALRVLRGEEQAKTYTP
jgi:butyrate kinase